MERPSLRSFPCWGWDLRGFGVFVLPRSAARAGGGELGRSSDHTCGVRSDVAEGGGREATVGQIRCIGPSHKGERGVLVGPTLSCRADRLVWEGDRANSWRKGEQTSKGAAEKLSEKFESTSPPCFSQRTVGLGGCRVHWKRGQTETSCAANSSGFGKQLRRRAHVTKISRCST